MEIRVKGRKYRVNNLKPIDKGGEADIYDLGKGQALKIFKTEDHPDLYNRPDAQAAARYKLKEQQKKLPRFPKNLPSRVIIPIEIAYQKSKIAGYTMRFLKNSEPLMKYGQKNFRSHGISDKLIMDIFFDIRRTVIVLHSRNVIIGDFNDLNILIKKDQAYFIDVDSWQFSGFLASAYMNRFLDPLKADIKNERMELFSPYDIYSDWYSFNVMLFQSLLFVDPYGGVYRPKAKKNRLKESLRPLKRITVFHPEVRYPKPARPYTILPDDLLHYFEDVFIRDQRGKFPKKLLEIEWQTCSGCGETHGRAQCPNCRKAPPTTVIETIVIRGQVKMRPVFKTKGQILFSGWYSGLRWLYYESENFFREQGEKILSGPLKPGMRYRLNKEYTYIGKGNMLAIIDFRGGIKKVNVDNLNNLSIFDVNHNNYFYMQNGNLYRNDEWTPARIGEAILGQTLFWVGDKIGFGFYSAGRLSEAFLFRPETKGFNYIRDFRFPSGQLLDSTCFIAEKLVWFLMNVRVGSRSINYCRVINQKAEILAEATTEKGNSSWLGQIRGKTVIGDKLLSATDDGIVRIGISDKDLRPDKTFANTERFVQADSHLVTGDNGVYVIDAKTINHLEIV